MNTAQAEHRYGIILAAKSTHRILLKSFEEAGWKTRSGGRPTESSPPAMLYHGGRLREYADMMRYAGFTHNHHRVDFRIAYNTWTEIPKTICRRALRKASKYPLVKINVLTDPDWSGILSVILSCYKYRIRPIDT